MDENRRSELIRGAMEAAAALVEDMAAEMDAVDPTAGAALCAALASGERPALILEFAPDAPTIRLCLVGPTEQVRQVMNIAALRSTRQ